MAKLAPYLPVHSIPNGGTSAATAQRSSLSMISMRVRERARLQLAAGDIDDAGGEGLLWPSTPKYTAGLPSAVCLTM